MSQEPRKSSKLIAWIRQRGFPIGIALFLVVVGLATASIFRFVQINRSIAHTNAVLYQINELQTSIERLETGARGYLLTSNKDFQINYAAARTKLQADVVRLRQITQDNPEQQEQIHLIDALGVNRIAELDTIMAKVGKRPISKLAREFGLASVRKLRDASRKLEGEELDLLRERELEAAALATAAGTWLVLGAAIALYFILSSYRALQLSSRESRRAREAAVEASRLKSDFLATMSHEIRTPMNGVMGMSTLLLNTPLSAEQTSYVKTIKTSADSLLGLINRILDHSKIEAGRLELECQDFELAAVFNSAMDLFRYWARSKRVEMRLDLDSTLPRVVWGDQDRLRQVLVNLIGNALKFTDKGFVEVSVTPEEPGVPGLHKFRVEVLDSGPGIPQEVQSRLFKKFSQVHSHRSSSSGSGLGLMISRELVRAMGGEIGLDSQEGQGSLFWFTFTAGPAKTARLAATPRALQARQLAGHVLIVEDQPINQAVVGKFLESFGLSYAMVKDGREAVEAVATDTYDLVLMDCQMDGMDGYQATQEIRRSEKGGHRIPIVAVTAEGMMADRERCFAVGMDEFISKPVDIDRLHMILEKYLPAAAAPEFERKALENLDGFQSGDRPLLDVLVDDFFGNGKKLLADLETAFMTRQTKQVNQLAHALKSAGRTLGLLRLGQLCQDLERAKDLDASSESTLMEVRKAYERGCVWLTNRSLPPV